MGSFCCLGSVIKGILHRMSGGKREISVVVEAAVETIGPDL